MLIKNVQAGTVKEKAAELGLSEDQALMLLIGEKSQVNIPEIIDALNEAGITFFGGLFTGIIYEDQRYEEGAIISAVPVLQKPYLIRGLNDDNFTIPDMNSIIKDIDEKKTALILVDGLTGNIAGFLSRMYNHLANTVNYFGGGAGSLSLEQQPCLFCNEGFFQDAALVVLLNRQASLGVRHGWERIMGPFAATRTDNTKVHELNWNNAFQVYKEIVEENSGQKFTEDNFFDIAKGYPFGMMKEYAECIVRDPIAVGAEGELICVGEVPENAVLEILKGVDESLINAAGTAASDCKDAAGKNISHGLVIDCISRVLFLEDKFNDELGAVRRELNAIDEGMVSEGILTLGEISSYGDGFLEFFNKTIVVGVFYE